jgi:hypothetical protein
MATRDKTQKRWKVTAKESKTNTKAIEFNWVLT